MFTIVQRNNGLVAFGFLLLVGLSGVLYKYADTVRPLEIFNMPDLTSGQAPARLAASEQSSTPSMPSIPTAPDTPAHDAGDEPVFRLEIVNTYPHDPRAYTQGLLYLGHDTLYESTGIRGRSNVRKVELKSGKVSQSTKNERRDFGEGLAYYKGFFWQLIWQERTVYKYEPVTLKYLGKHSMPSEFDFEDGWGLTSTSDGLESFHENGQVPKGEQLFVTDSGTKLYRVDLNEKSGSFTVLHKIEIKTKEGKPLHMANELELIGVGEVWANVYGLDCIARIDTHTGVVNGWILGGNLRKENLGTQAEVFNGIAYDKKDGRIFVTGKLWSKLFEVKLVPLEKPLPRTELHRQCVPARNVFHAP